MRWTFWKLWWKRNDKTLRGKWKGNNNNWLHFTRNRSVPWCRGWSYCMSARIINLFVLLFFRHLPQLAIASSPLLCFVFIQTSLREISERCRWGIQERYGSDFWCRGSPKHRGSGKIPQCGCCAVSQYVDYRWDRSDPCHAICCVGAFSFWTRYGISCAFRWCVVRHAIKRSTPQGIPKNSRIRYGPW